MKKFYFLTLALICAFVANADTFTAGTKFYLNPSIQWSEANARFALHVAADNTGATVAWVDMTDEDGDGVYEAEAPEGNWTIVDFCRMNPATTENNWDNKWGAQAILYMPEIIAVLLPVGVATHGEHHLIGKKSI